MGAQSRTLSQRFFLASAVDKHRHTFLVLAKITMTPGTRLKGALQT